MVKLIKLKKVGDRYTFDELIVNPKSVSSVESDFTSISLLKEQSNIFPEELGKDTFFTSIVVDGITHTVVGTPASINQKLYSNKRQLILG